MSDIVRLAALARPLPKAEFPNGSVHQLVAMDAEAFRLLRDGLAAPDDVSRNAKALELLHRCVPTASTEDLNTLGSEDVTNIFKMCTRQEDPATGGARTLFAAVAPSTIQ